MWQLAAETEAAYVAMHMQGTPQTMQINPVYDSVVNSVDEFFANRLQRIVGEGVPPERIVLDVGIGFGKTVEQNLELLRGLKNYTKYRRPLLLGVSRKSFLGRVAGATEVAGRLPGGLACACWAVERGVSIIRTHDVALTLRAVRMTERILARTNE